MLWVALDSFVLELESAGSFNKKVNSKDDFLVFGSQNIIFGFLSYIVGSHRICKRFAVEVSRTPFYDTSYPSCIWLSLFSAAKLRCQSHRIAMSDKS